VEEMDTLVDRLREYELNYREVIRGLTDAVQAEDYDPSMDEFIFSKMLFNLESKAKKMGCEKIGAAVYVELILADPSEAIRACILQPKKAEVPAAEDPEEVQADSSETNWDDIIKLLSPEGEEAEENGGAEAREEEPCGRDRLFDAVQNTRRIQSTLLEQVFGQDQAVNAFVSGYFQASLMSFSRRGTKKPQATFLFAGPPGVGKTFLAEKAAEALGLPYQRFDMSEYSDKEANLEFCGTDKVYKNGKRET
jgi:hypothetical protein